jgi:hypothetical protein
MEFKVAAISDNTNSFGLHGVVLIARDGTAYQVGASKLNLPKQNEVLDIDINNFAKHGFEIPEKLHTAPKYVVNEVWK